MGIRIHKHLGYGLTNVKCNRSGKIVDERFNLKLVNSVDFTGVCENEVARFVDWVEKKSNHPKVAEIVFRANGEMDQFKKLLKKYGNAVLTYCGFSLPSWGRDKSDPSWRKGFVSPVIHDSEFADPKVMLFHDPFSKDHYRYDDTIDYYENTGGNAPHVNRLKGCCGIYPYLGMIRIPGTTPASEKNTHKLEPATYNMGVGLWDKKRGPLSSGAELEDLQNNYRPVIDPTVIVLTHYLNIFSNWEKTVQELRPMIYTYWS